MNELLFKPSALLFSRSPFSLQTNISKQFSYSFFPTSLSTPPTFHRAATPIRSKTSSSSSSSSSSTPPSSSSTKKTTSPRIVYPELDQPLKKEKKFDPVTNIRKFPDDDFDFDSLRYQKVEGDEVDPEELAEDEKERAFRKIQKEKAKVRSGRIDFGNDINITKWSENSYDQLLDALSDHKRNLLITKASLTSLKNFLKKGEEFVDLRKEVYQFGKHRPKDFSFQRNFPHTFSHEPDPVIDYPPPQPEPTPIQVKTVLALTDDQRPQADHPFFKLPPARKLPNGGTYAVGRRKAAIARCFLTEGVGKITVNDRPLDEYFRFDDRRNAMRPLTLTETEHFFDIRIDLIGGGTTGQADAVKFGISRCILKYDPQYWWVLHGDRLLQGDRRRVEPKKYGRHKARRGNQWVKR